MQHGSISLQTARGCARLREWACTGSSVAEKAILGSSINTEAGYSLAFGASIPSRWQKILHLPHVLSFAWLHNTALWSHYPPGKAREKGAESLCPKRIRP